MLLDSQFCLQYIYFKYITKENIEYKYTRCWS